jgi:ribosomal protein S27AE
MEASKCPKCGDEPRFIEHIEKWYCYGCNSYIEEESEQAPKDSGTDEKAVPAESNDASPAPSAEKVATCNKCGAELECVGEGKLYCFICERYPSEDEPEPHASGPGLPINDAQDLIDRIIDTPSAQIPKEPLPGVTPIESPSSVMAPEPSEGSVPEPDQEAPPAAKPEPKVEALPEVKMCPVCKQPLKYIEKYDRYYCYGCRKYAPKDLDRAHMAAPVEKTHGRKICPTCRRELKYIEKYKEYYCFSCKCYPLRRQRAGTPAKAIPPKHAALSCPKCGERLRWIERYQRHYCFACKSYAPKGFGSERKECPLCHGQMRYVPEYNEWYCYKCKKYSLRPTRPVLLV